MEVPVLKNLGVETPLYLFSCWVCTPSQSASMLKILRRNQGKLKAFQQ